MADYFATIAGQLGITVWLLVILIIWSAVWKLLALWRAARNNHIAWFIVLAIINTAGILPILYLFVFSKLRKQLKPSPKRKSKK